MIWGKRRGKESGKKKRENPNIGVYCVLCTGINTGIGIPGFPMAAVFRTQPDSGIGDILVFSI